MGAKAKTVYRCTECGAEHLRWSGKCDTCGEWNTLVEEVAAPRVLAGGSARRKAGLTALGSGGAVSPTPRIRDVIGAEDHRLRTGLAEFDFVLGGGIVPGSMVLVGGGNGNVIGGGFDSVIGGGFQNFVNASFATVPGGANN